MGVKADVRLAVKASIEFGVEQKSREANSSEDYVSETTTYNFVHSIPPKKMVMASQLRQKIMFYSCKEGGIALNHMMIICDYSHNTISQGNAYEVKEFALK